MHKPLTRGWGLPLLKPQSQNMLRGGSFSATPQTNVLSLTRQSRPSSSETYRPSSLKSLKLVAGNALAHRSGARRRD